MLPGKKHIGRPAITGPAELAAVRGLIADGKSVTAARSHPQDRTLHCLRHLAGVSDDHGFLRSAGLPAWRVFPDDTSAGCLI